jgi:hypothetical protein
MKRGTDRGAMRSRPQRKRGQRPPWGTLLGGKPIEHQAWIFGTRVKWDDHGAEQYSRMLRLKHHYGIIGGDHKYPTGGLGHLDWFPWYELALRIASDLDQSLKIVDIQPPARTAARWRGPEGAFLLRIVGAMRETRPQRSISWCLQELQKRSPGLAKIPLKTLTVRYQDAKKYFDTTERARKRKHPS